MSWSIGVSEAEKMIGYPTPFILFWRIGTNIKLAYKWSIEHSLGAYQESIKIHGAEPCGNLGRTCASSEDLDRLLFFALR